MSRHPNLVNKSLDRSPIRSLLFMALAVGIIYSSCSSSFYSVLWTSSINQFTSGIEGPATDFNGNVYAVNYKSQGTIGIITPDGRSDVFAELPHGSIGNGIRFNSLENFYVADYTNHNVLNVNISTKEITIYAHSDDMNQPNDLAIAKNGQLFLSDPNWKESTGNLWRVDTGGKISLLESNMGTTNGIEVSPNEDKLYVNESVQKNVWVYDLSSRGQISNKQLLHKFPDYGMDGMRCDLKGNLYITRHGKGTVAILSPEGTLLREVKLTGTKPSNIAFGGVDGKTCYVTLQDKGCIDSFRTEHPGREWSWYHHTD